MILYFGFEVCSVSQFIGCCKGVRFLFNNAQTDKYWSNRGKKFVSADPEDSLACSAAVMMLSTFDELASEFDTTLHSIVLIVLGVILFFLTEI